MVSPEMSLSPAMMAAPPPPSATKQRKKPGPKAKPKPPKLPLSLIVKLKVPTARLTEFSKGASQSTSVGDGTPNGSSPGGASPRVSPGASESAGVNGGQKKRSVPGPKPSAAGVKRVRAPPGLGAKPGRKKMKLDPNAPSSIGGGTKLGPKANMGAINDKLRALDRTGKPCKRWTKSGFTLKSFTGVQWTVPTWGKPTTQPHSSDANIAASAASENASANQSLASETPPEMKMDITDPSMPRPPISEIALPQGITA